MHEIEYMATQNFGATGDLLFADTMQSEVWPMVYNRLQPFAAWNIHTQEYFWRKRGTLWSWKQKLSNYKNNVLSRSQFSPTRKWNETKKKFANGWF